MCSILFTNINCVRICFYKFVCLYKKGEWHFLISGGATVPKKLPNPASDWLSDRAWGEVLMLAALVRRMMLYYMYMRM